MFKKAKASALEVMISRLSYFPYANVVRRNP